MKGQNSAVAKRDDRGGMVVNEVYLDMPLDDGAIAKLRLGDIVYLSGVLYTSREGAYSMLFDRGIPPPVDVAALSNVSFNCSPAVREEKDGSYTIPSITATCQFQVCEVHARIRAPLPRKSADRQNRHAADDIHGCVQALWSHLH